MQAQPTSRPSAQGPVLVVCTQQMGKQALLAGMRAWAQQALSGALSSISKKQFQRHPGEDV